MYELYFEPEAVRDISECILGYDSKVVGLGERFRKALDRRLDLLQSQPRSYAIIRGRTRATLVPKFQDVVYYRVARRKVIIMAVIHGRRHPSTWKRRSR